ncbi:MAG: hypothetical protein E4H01_17010, partial [Lysobacterales bacterium]
INGGEIAALETHRDRPGAILVDMGDLTALPGLVDAAAALPADAGPALGPLLLSFGVTTIVANHPQSESLNAIWSGKDMPGPRVLGKDWQLDLESAPTLLLGVSALPASPRGIRYRDLTSGAGAAPATMFSGLADAGTQGLGALLESRQVTLLEPYPRARRRFSEQQPLAAVADSLVLGSKLNGMPPGIATQAELLALAAAGLSGEQALRTAGSNAAAALGLERHIGRIAPGYAADIVLVDGDPLGGVAAAQKVVAVVRNGRFYSVIGLLERAERALDVE